MRILWTFKYTLLTFPDRDPAFPHMASQVYFLPVAHRPKSPEQQNLCPSRNLFLSRNRRSYNENWFTPFQVHCRIVHFLVWNCPDQDSDGTSLCGNFAIYWSG